MPIDDVIRLGTGISLGTGHTLGDRIDSPSLSVFGRILSAHEIEESTIDLLKKWFPTYLHELEKQLVIEYNSLIAPKTYDNRNKFDALPGEELPKVVVISPGLHGDPTQRGDGRIDAVWRVGVGVAIAAKTEEEANKRTKVYGAIARAIMLQQGGELNARVTLLDEQYVDLPISDQIQQYRAASVFFAVDVENIMNKRKGPATPDEEPYSYGKAQTVDVSIVKEEING